jgi:hypothetical protein
MILPFLFEDGFRAMTRRKAKVKSQNQLTVLVPVSTQQALKEIEINPAL